MPIVWGAHNNSDIYINVGIIDASAINLASTAPVSATPISPPSMFRALIDTGAQKTMISPNVISALNLPPLGKILISGVGPSAHYHNAYLFHVAFVMAIAGAVPSSAGQVSAVINVLQTPIYGAEIPSTGGQFDVLLGMDVISGGQLVVGNGVFSFAW
jgi:Aspartyl protease